ncbi:MULTISPECIES: hypothetical protein [unclassified Streptomyces]|uniref:hypothetical protein n=1 Tax=unclassified Streptomyces TaxID=2593676 RepID=UPI00382B26C6
MARPSLPIRLVLAAVFTAVCSAAPAVATQAHPVANPATTLRAADTAESICPHPAGIPIRCKDTSWGG